VRLGRILLVLGATLVAAASCFDDGSAGPDAGGDPFVSPDAAIDAEVSCNGGFSVVPCICTPGEILSCYGPPCGTDTLMCPETGIDLERISDCECERDAYAPEDADAVDGTVDGATDAPSD
jgi:hypothetical protein